MWQMSDTDLVILTIKIFGIGLFLCAVAVLFGAIVCIGIDEVRKSRRQGTKVEAEKTQEIVYARGVANLLVDEPRQLVKDDTQVLRFEELQNRRDRRTEFTNFTKMIREIKK